jgi:hypothetical protein
MYWNEHQIRSAEIKILKPHSPEWQTVRAKLLAAGKRETVAFMDYQARQGKGWNVRGVATGRASLSRSVENYICE